MLVTIVSILLFIGMLSSLATAVYIYKLNRQSSINKFLALTLTANAAWISSTYFIFRFPSAHALSLGFITATFIPTFSLLFIQAFMGKLKSWLTALCLTPIILLAIIGLYPGLIIKSIVAAHGNIITMQPGPLYFVDVFLILIFVIFSVFQIIKALKKSTGIQRLQLYYIVIGYTMAVGFAILFNIVLPAFNYYSLGYLGSIFFIFMTLAMAYAITKHYIYDVQVVVSELLVFLLGLLSIVWLVLNPILFNIILFILIVSICGLFIRSIISEAEKKKQLQLDKAALQKLDELKDEFLQMTEHELNTPIGIMEGKLSMILNEDFGHFTPQQKEFLTPVFKDAKRLARLSKELVEVSEIDQGEMKIFSEKVYLIDLIAEIVSLYRPEAEKKGLKIEIVVPEDLPTINIDRGKILHVLTNLVENAIKFTSSGGIRISAELKKDKFIISISDTGIGIKKEDQENIFGKFYQANRFAETPMEQQGTGLSLYIVKNIIKLHGGRIWLDSKPGHGSTFSFSLPLR